MENGWDKYQLLVLNKLEVLETNISRLERNVNDMGIIIEGLKFKAGLLGALSGAIPTSIGLIWLIMKG